jgi:hypothetical protein
MMTAVGESIRSKIGKLKKKIPVKRSMEKKTIGQTINGSADELYYGWRDPRWRSWRSISSGAARCGSMGGG